MQTISLKDKKCCIIQTCNTYSAKQSLHYIDDSPDGELVALTLQMWLFPFDALRNLFNSLESYHMRLNVVFMGRGGHLAASDEGHVVNICGPRPRVNVGV